MRSLKELMDLKGSVALVTGGAGFLGSVVAEGLAELGAQIAILDIDRESSDRIAARLESVYGTRVLKLAVDLSDEDAARAVPEAVLKEFGRIDIIVHNAAWRGTTNFPGWAVPFSMQTVEAWDLAMRVNLTSAFALIQQAQDALSVSGRGSVILMSSIYGLVGPDMRLYEGTSMGNPAGYAASKGGLLQLMRYLATVLAPRTRVNSISPGGIARGQNSAFVERYQSKTPLGRMATEEDIKGAVAYLATDLSAYVTGQTIVVDGGWTAW